MNQEQTNPPATFEEPISYDHGTTFFIQIPYAAPEEELVPTDPVLPDQTECNPKDPPSERPKKILTISSPAEKTTEKLENDSGTMIDMTWYLLNEPEESILKMKLLRQTHPLRFSWSLWYFKMDKQKNWEECFWKIATFNTVEDFYGTVLNIAKPTELVYGNDYYMFKENIKPMWEDDANKHGGRWLIMIDRHVRCNLLDSYWENLLNLMIGNRFGETEGDYVCGAVVNPRQKGDKISLWTKDSGSTEINQTIGQKIKAEL